MSNTFGQLRLAFEMCTLGTSEMRETVTKLGGVMTLGTPEELGRFMAEQTDKWREVGRKAGVRVE